MRTGRTRELPEFPESFENNGILYTIDNTGFIVCAHLNYAAPLLPLLIQDNISIHYNEYLEGKTINVYDPLGVKELQRKIVRVDNTLTVPNHNSIEKKRVLFVLGESTTVAQEWFDKTIGLYDYNYCHPENNLYPSEQSKWIKNLLESNFETIIIKTNSEIILRNVQILVKKGLVKNNDFSIVQFSWDKGINNNYPAESETRVIGITEEGF